MIQLAGAFVHLQKKRPGPSAALFRLADANLRAYAPVHAYLDVAAVLELISNWMAKIQEQSIAELLPDSAPRVELAWS